MWRMCLTKHLTYKRLASLAAANATSLSGNERGSSPGMPQASPRATAMNAAAAAAAAGVDALDQLLPGGHCCLRGAAAHVQQHTPTEWRLPRARAQNSMQLLAGCAGSGGAGGSRRPCTRRSACVRPLPRLLPIQSPPVPPAAPQPLPTAPSPCSQCLAADAVPPGCEAAADRARKARGGRRGAHKLRSPGPDRCARRSTGRGCGRACVLARVCACARLTAQPPPRPCARACACAALPSRRPAACRVRSSVGVNAQRVATLPQ